MGLVRKILVWVLALCILIVPLLIAAQSPLLAWRQPVYIAAGFSGIIGLGLLFLQPLLAQGMLPMRSRREARDLHFWLGLGLIAAVLVHVAGLWITSPPDMIDALLFRAPTAFSYLGVIAMWAIFLAGGVMVLRKRVALSPIALRLIHRGLVVVIVATTIAHALLIEGTMGIISKWVLCLFASLALLKALFDIRRKQRF